MKLRDSASRIRRQWLSGGIAALVTAGIGGVLVYFSIGGTVSRLSYDIPYALRSQLPADDAVMVYIDESSHDQLKQSMSSVWDRELHAKLVDRLVKEGARAIVFDVLFDPSTNAVAEAEFARAIADSQRVILCGQVVSLATVSGAPGKLLELPYEPFRTNAAGWGTANYDEDPDYGVRKFFGKLDSVAGQTNILWLADAVAGFIHPGKHTPGAAGVSDKWLNYLGPPGTIPGVSYSQALLDEAEPGFFKDKIVFIGGLLSADYSGKGKDEFRTPYALWAKGFMPGVEIHATATLNLLHDNWLKRVPDEWELALVIAFGLGIGFVLMRLQPIAAVSLGFVLAATIIVTGHVMPWYFHMWYSWVVLLIQLAIALSCSVVFNSLKLYVEKRLLEESLAAHLSPKLVKRLLSEPALRKLGGTQQEVSILFTDIANFSHISETMHSDDLVRLMNKYYSVALQCIHETDATVVKLIGDSIFAIWNAPVAQKDHRQKACQAALALRNRVVEFDMAHLNVPLRTRVGLHAGEACVGNIGSENRFDYTALGENINLTSRLEGLNKFLGTAVLMTRDVQRSVEDQFVWRMVGHFRFKGLGKIVEVYELVGSPETAEASKVWRTLFAQALQDFCQRRFDDAAAKFQQTIDLRKIIEPDVTTGTSRATSDGPSRFYLERIEEFKQIAPPREWVGEIEMKEK